MIRYTFDWEIQTCSTMLMNAFHEIIVKRFNVHKQARDQIKARVVYAPKQRVLNDLLDKDQNIQLPAVSVYIGGITRDESRVYNKILGTFHTPANSTASVNEKGPLPVDIVYNVSIMTRYQQDMDQILSHLLPYINPYFVVSWRTPNRPDFEIRSNVFWNGNVNITYPVDMAATQVARVVADLSFTFKGWLFQNQETVENIFTFNTAFASLAVGMPTDYLLDVNVRETDENVDVIINHAAPPRPQVVEPYAVQAGTLPQINVWGTGFEHITNVYLSGYPLSGISTLQDPFSANLSLSADYPSFTGVKLLSTEWAYDRTSFMTFVMPSASAPGKVDVIMENQAGYSLLTQNVRINTFNPFDPTMPEYASFVPYQMPYLSGIEIFS